MENNNLPPPGGGNQPEPTPLKFYEFRSRTNSINDNIIHNILEKHIPITIATSICFTTTTTTSFASPIASSSLQSYTTSSVIHLNRPKMSTIQNPIPVFENNSKRKSSPPIKTMNNNNKAKKQKTIKSWLSAPKQQTPFNRFELLSSDDSDSDEDDNVSNIPQNVPKTAKPPPIFLQNVEYIAKLTSGLDQIAENQYHLKILQNNEVNIQATESQFYSSIIKLLDKKNSCYYT